MKRMTLTTMALAITTPALAATPKEVLSTYSKIAAAKYEDSLITAQRLQEAVNTLVSNPSAENLNTACAAWLAARVPYQQTEVYRFRNAIVEDWEGKVNAWPLDEGLIDYVDASYGGPTDENAAAALNVIANPTFTLSGTEIDATAITPTLLAETLHEADGVEANVATGYHAIEFLLWGQDLNGHGAGAGDRPWTEHESFGVPLDMGCSWVSARDRNSIARIAEKKGYTLVSHTDAPTDLFRDGKPASEQDYAE